MMIDSVIIKSSEAKIVKWDTWRTAIRRLRGGLIAKRCRTNGVNGGKMLEIPASKLLAEQPGTEPAS